MYILFMKMTPVGNKTKKYEKLKKKGLFYNAVYNAVI